MNMKKVIGDLKNRALNEDFMRMIHAEYEADPDIAFAEVEQEYQAAMAALRDVTPEQRQLLEERERLAEENQHYAVHFGFASGLFSAFRQYFAPSDLRDDDFAQLVMDGLFAHPGIDRHREFLEAKQRGNELIGRLSDSLQDEALGYHVTSIDCALDNREHYAVLMSFYCGYRTALSVLDTVAPTASLKMVDRLLLTEYQLGLITGYDLRQRT